MIGAVVGATINVDGRRKTATGEECPKAEDAVQFARRGGFEPDGRGGELLGGGFGRANGGEDWVRVEAPATQCPRISAAFLEEERRQMGEAWFRQEYMCEFVEDGRQMFEREVVMGAMEDLGTLM